MDREHFGRLVRHVVVTLVDEEDVEEVVASMMLTWSGSGYSAKAPVLSDVYLLSPAGKLMLALLLNPRASNSELSKITGLTDRGIRQLMTKVGPHFGVVRTKVGKDPVRTVDPKRVFSHPDIVMMVEAFNSPVGLDHRKAD